MKIILVLTGKTTEKYLAEGIDNYTGRLKRYVPFEIRIIPDLKNTRSMSSEQVKDAEGKLIAGQIGLNDCVVLLDENGDQFDSTGFAGYIEKKMTSGCKNLLFVIGGPYGFSRQVYERANHRISFSRMTFSHQLIRLVFAEQLYRAFTIIKGEPYHHD